jgi:hypothetical protein
LHASTARILHDRFGVISREGDGWVVTPRGWALLAGERAEEKRWEVEQQLSAEDREWANRVLAWMEAHKRFDRREYTAKRYAKHVAACDRAGIDPVAVGKWADGWREWVEQAVRSAASCLEDFDERLKLAKERGVGVSVAYEADEKVPRSRREAATAASQGSIVSLSTYRARRPGQGAA